MRVWPFVNRVLAGGPAPDERSQQAVNLVNAWVANGASRLDRDLDGKVDDPGAAVLDQSWDQLSEAVLRPVLGDLAAPGGLLGRLVSRDDSPRTQERKRLRHGLVRLRREGPPQPARGPRARRLQPPLLRQRRPGRLPRLAVGGDPELGRCPGGEPGHGPERLASRRHGGADRVQAGLIPESMRWTNRPTFQQLMEFDGHR